jgi:osmotically-inducible protein OsmY
MSAVIKTTTNLLGAVLIAATCVACSERTEDKVEQKADQAGNAAERAADSTGNAVANGGRAADAAVETLDVKTALTLDKRVDASNINVDSDHVTKTVTLKGHVPTAEQKTLAGQIAAAKAVGYQVRNDLTIGR